MKPTRNDYYDLGVLYNLTGGDTGFMQHMIRGFLDKAPEQARSLQQAAQAQAWDEVGGAAHKIKSSVRSMGIHSLIDDVLQIEQDAKNKQNTDTLAERCDRFEQELQHVCQLLQNETSH
ncbi:MAG: Hpt domain-containing protein [Leptolyngbya sp. SIO3F4]|nr:Hpt domain-containing protein [Leptolyngbya sp. SIO3F4]